MSEPLHHGRSYFDAMYSESADPWGFDDRFYERRKYDVTLASLPERRYRRAFEPGCANGALTRLLADRCDELVAAEFVPSVAQRARERLRDRPHVSVVTERFPQYWPPGTGDLVVLSEVAYYLTDAGARAALRRLDSWLEADGHVIAVHFTGSTDYPRPGRAVVPWLDAVPGLTRIVTHDDEHFELAVWRRTTRPNGRHRHERTPSCGPDDRPS